MAVNPFENLPGSQAGASAFRQAYDRLKAESQAAKRNVAQDYASTYQQLRGQQYTQGLGAAAQRGLSGGQAAGMRQQISAQQMGALGNLMQGQERAVRDIQAGEASRYSNALLEGQQAQEYAQRQQQSAFEKQTLVNNILNKKGDFTGYSKDQQFNALLALGYTREQADRVLTGKPAGMTPDTTNQPTDERPYGNF
jgi:hypothetical protein